MEEFAKLVGRFFARDLIYISGGLMPTGTAAIVLGEWSTTPSQVPATILAIFVLGASYGIGFALRILLTLTQLTQDIAKEDDMNPLDRWLYSRLRGPEMSQVQHGDAEADRRTSDLQHLTSTFSACLIPTIGLLFYGKEFLLASTALILAAWLLMLSRFYTFKRSALGVQALQSQ